MHILDIPYRIRSRSRSRDPLRSAGLKDNDSELVRSLKEKIKQLEQQNEFLRSSIRTCPACDVNYSNVKDVKQAKRRLTETMIETISK